MALVAGDRDRLRATFDGAALLYDGVRPGYPGRVPGSAVGLIGGGQVTNQKR